MQDVSERSTDIRSVHIEYLKECTSVRHEIYNSRPEQGPRAVPPTGLKKHEKCRVGCQISVRRSAQSEVMRSGSSKVENKQSRTLVTSELILIQSHVPAMRLLFHSSMRSVVKVLLVAILLNARPSQLV